MEGDSGFPSPAIIDESSREALEVRVSTAFGIVKVSIWGERKKHPILTVHDLGLDAENNFQNFFQFQTAQELASRFCVYNINLPGQEMDAKPTADNYCFPSMDGIAQIVQSVVEHLKIRTFIGMGIGLGANVLLRYSLKYMEKVDALILINASKTKASWTEWAYQKININSLRWVGMTPFTVDYLMWYHFGRHLETCSQDITNQYRIFFRNHPNPTNLAALIEAYINRTEVILRDPTDPSVSLLHSTPVLQIVGADSAFVDDSVIVNSQLNPVCSEWLKISDSCGLVLDDKPEEVTQAIMLFLQGLGYMPAVNVNRVINDLTDAHNRQTARISTVSGSEAITNAQYTKVQQQPAASITISNERG